MPQALGDAIPTQRTNEPALVGCDSQLEKSRHVAFFQARVTVGLGATVQMLGSCTGNWRFERNAKDPRSWMPISITVSLFLPL